jgi:hypothetical protein
MAYARSKRFERDTLSYTGANNQTDQQPLGFVAIAAHVHDSSRSITTQLYGTTSVHAELLVPLRQNHSMQHHDSRCRNRQADLPANSGPAARDVLLIGDITAIRRSVRRVNSGSYLPDRAFHRTVSPWFEMKCGITSPMNSSSERIATSCGKPNDAP